MEQVKPKLSEWMAYDKLIPYVEPGDLIEIRRLNFYFETIQHWVVAVECHPQECFVVSLTDDSIVRRDSLSSIVYGNSCRINNLRDSLNKPLAKESIVKRAIGSIGGNGRPYNFTEYNCEHFATKCRNDVAISHQVENAGFGLIILGNMYRIASNWFSALILYYTGMKRKKYF